MKIYVIAPIWIDGRAYCTKNYAARSKKKVLQKFYDSQDEKKFWIFNDNGDEELQEMTFEEFYENFEKRIMRISENNMFVSEVDLD